MSATLNWIAPRACANGWLAPTTRRIGNVVKKLMQEVINIITASDLPKALVEVKGPEKTLKKTLRASLPTLTDQEPATVQQKLSTVGWSACEAPLWALEI